MQPDRPLEGFQVEATAPRTKNKGEAVPADPRDHDGSTTGIELTVEGADVDRGIRPIRHRDVHVAVVRAEGVLAGVLERAIIDDVAVDRRRRHAGGRDAHERHIPVHVVRGDITAGVGHAHVVIHGAYVDAPLGIGKGNAAFDRLERDAPVAAADVDLAVHRLDADPALDAVDPDVVVDAGDAQLGPHRHGYHVIHAAGRAVPRLRLDGERRSQVSHFEPVAIVTVRHDTDGAFLPRPDHRLATEVLDLQPRAGPNRYHGVDLLRHRQRHGHQRHHTQQHLALSLQLWTAVSAVARRSRSIFRLSVAAR